MILQILIITVIVIVYGWLAFWGGRKVGYGEGYRDAIHVVYNFRNDDHVSQGKEYLFDLSDDGDALILRKKKS